MQQGSGTSDASMAKVWSKLLLALLSGTIAIAINMGLLTLASALGIKTALGGLLTLVVSSARNASAALYLPGQWILLALPSSATWFQDVFHVTTGLCMAILYVFLLANKLPGAAFTRGAIFGSIVWVLNAFVVLPSIGEGIAGHNSLTTIGMLFFGFAHMVFFIVLALLSSRFRPHFEPLAHSDGVHEWA